MAEIRIPQIIDESYFLNTEISEIQNFPIHPIACVNWPETYPYKPDVKFLIAHNNREIFLRFFVYEQSILAMVTKDNGEVWTDSCVEFFISFDENGYYNFEFSCIGKMLLGFRKEKNKFIHADQEILDTIQRKSSLGDQSFPEVKGEKYWELYVKIPVSAFFNHSFSSLSGLKAKANFYKCGDNLSVPHFLSWNPIDNPTPNFHLEKDFGNIYFD